MQDLLVSVFLSIPLIGAFTIFALGISAIYRASHVLNLAHGAMAMLPAYIAYSLSQAGVPMFVTLPVAVIVGALLGIGVEYVFVRRLRPQGPTAQTVGTVAVGGLIIAVAAKIWGTTPIIAPLVFPKGELRIAGAAVRWGDIGLFFVGLLVAAGLFAFFKLTDYGLAMRGAAENRRGASLVGINPNMAAAAAWALGGGLAGLAGVLLAAVTNLDPYNLTLQVLPAFVAVLIGRLESMPGAVVGSFIAGIMFGLAPTLAKVPGLQPILGAGGAPQLLLTVLALVVMAMRGGRFSGAAEASAAFTGGAVFRAGRGRRFNPFVLLVAAVMVLLPFFAPFSIVGDSLLAMEYAIVAASLVVLIGWVGQISLAQASFVGIGALVTAMITRGWGIGFPFSLVLGAFVAAAAAVLLGMVALRVRGLYLAVATLIFAWMADAFLFPSPWLGAQGGSSTIPDQRIGLEGGAPALDLTARKTLYFVILAVLVLILAGLSNLRDTKVGRAFFAVRGSEMAAASLGIDVVRYKLIAFALSGLIAGIGGGIFMLNERTVVPAQAFLFTVSLQYLAIAVVGGLTSLGGAVAAGIVFALLNELFFSVRFLAGWLEVVSAGLLAFVLLTYPGGLSAALSTLRDVLSRAFLRRFARGRRARETREPAEARRPSRVRSLLGRVGSIPIGAARGIARLVRKFRPAKAKPASAEAEDWLAIARVDDDIATATVTVAGEAGGNGDAAHPSGPLHLKPRTGRFPLPPHREDRRPLLDAEGIVVRFGGLTAVNEASLSVREGEIVGLIGPNGAGKTTFFNAILGFNSPVAGRVSLYGTDVTGWAPHMRARLGVGRTFQVLQLFNELTVFDNLLVATHLHDNSTLLSNLTASGRTLLAEAETRERVHEVLRLLSLDELAYESVRGLPFGVLRMVELGRALVTGARVLMLDEIASGLNDAETLQLAQTIQAVRSLGVSILLIEHDVHMVVSISDYMYVLDQGKLIAEGPPSAVQRDPAVIAAYLGGAVDTPAPAAV